MIKKLTTPGRQIGFLYLLALVLWLAKQLVCFGIDSAYPEIDLLAAEIQLVNLEQMPGQRLQATTEDPQLIVTGIEDRVRVIRMQADFEFPQGEMDLYYLTAENGEPAFSVKKRVFAKPLGNGIYEYTLKPGKYTFLRIDPGNTSHNPFVVNALVANPKKPLGSYLVPSPRSLLGLVMVPALAYCVIYTIIEGVMRLRIKDRPSQEEE